jgi:hypothetical protein
MQPVGPRRSKFIQCIHVAPNSLIGPSKRHLTSLPFVHLSLVPFAWSPLGHVVRNTLATPPLKYLGSTSSFSCSVPPEAAAAAVATAPSVGG